MIPRIASFLLVAVLYGLPSSDCYQRVVRVPLAVALQAGESRRVYHQQQPQHFQPYVYAEEPQNAEGENLGFMRDQRLPTFEEMQSYFQESSPSHVEVQRPHPQGHNFYQGHPGQGYRERESGNEGDRGPFSFQEFRQEDHRGDYQGQEPQGGQQGEYEYEGGEEAPYRQRQRHRHYRHNHPHPPPPPPRINYIMHDTPSRQQAHPHHSHNHHPRPRPHPPGYEEHGEHNTPQFQNIPEHSSPQEAYSHSFFEGPFDTDVEPEEQQSHAPSMPPFRNLLEETVTISPENLYHHHHRPHKKKHKTTPNVFDFSIAPPPPQEHGSGQTHTKPHFSQWPQVLSITKGSVFHGGPGVNDHTHFSNLPQQPHENTVHHLPPKNEGKTHITVSIFAETPRHEGPYHGTKPHPHPHPEPDPHPHPHPDPDPHQHPDPHPHPHPEPDPDPHPHPHPDPDPHQHPDPHPNSFHIPEDHTHPQQPKRPMVLKVSGLKGVGHIPFDKLPPGPPIFYAPSPDVALKQKKKQQQLRERQNLIEEGVPVGEETHTNFKRASKKQFLMKTKRRKTVKKQDLGGQAGQNGQNGQNSEAKETEHLDFLKQNGQIEQNEKNGQNSEIGQNEHLDFLQSDQTRQNTRKLQSGQNEQNGQNRQLDFLKHFIQNEREEQPLASTGGSRQSHHRRRRRRSLAPKHDPMLADGSEQEGYWSSPYIRFDRYKKIGEESGEDVQGRSAKSVNLTHHHDSNSEEQRFFPSFPSPYLGGLNPFGGGGLNSLTAPARAPLFPGPAANTHRSPSSRYHPSPFKFSAAPLANRGPSASASHTDRYHDNNLLGSGNFEVVRGGTYYGEEDDGPSYNHGGAPYHNGGGDDEDPYYGQNNGHSSPYRGGGDFFANFRDFADINPHSRSYSHQQETHVAAPSSQTPHNIFHKLEEEHETLDTASSGDNHQPQFSLDYDPMLATY